MSDFELNVPGYYTVQNVEENDFINDQNSESDKNKFGLTYWVKFTGNAETFLWTTKTEPQEGKSYYGHLQKTSGKSLRFKIDEEPDKESKAHTKSDKTDAYLKDATTTPIQIFNGSLNYAKDLGLNIIGDKQDRQTYLQYVKEITDELLLWIDNIRTGSHQEAHPPAATQVPQPKSQEARDLEIPPEFR